MLIATPWDIYLGWSLAPGQEPSKVQGSGHGWGDGDKAGVSVCGSTTQPRSLWSWGGRKGKSWAHLVPPRFRRSAPGRQGWVGTRAGPEPSQGDVWSSVGFTLVYVRGLFSVMGRPWLGMEVWL